MKYLLYMAFILSSITSIRAYTQGNSSGGGGDASEVRVNDIRIDLIKWISLGKAKELKLPKSISYNKYLLEMKKILKQKRVVVSFTENKIVVSGSEKTCKGFIEKDLKPHILCNISRFEKTSGADQYPLIHHEYAGLVYIESNIGAASDYTISSQLTGFLKEGTVLKLVVNENESDLETEVSIDDLHGFDSDFYYNISIDGKAAKEIFLKLKESFEHGGKVEQDYAMHRDIFKSESTFCVCSHSDRGGGDDETVYYCKIDIIKK